jgi:hypothetical protein
MNRSVSAAVTSAIGVAIISHWQTPSSAIARTVGRIDWSSLRGPKKDPTYQSGNRRQHAKTNEHLAHARKPSTLVHPYSEKVS